MIDYILGGLTLFSLFYLFIIRDITERRKEQLIFDNSSLGFVSALYLINIPLHCSLHEIESYIKDQLALAHKLPGNEFLLEYTTPAGYTYRSHTSQNDHALFVILCLVQYAKEHNNNDLLAWCNANIVSASKLHIHF